MAVGRRFLEHIPNLARRTWEDVAPELEDFLKRMWEDSSAGIPSGYSTAIPQLIEAGASGDAGEENTGWSAGDHIHPVGSGIPVGLGYTAEEGIAESLSRSDHIHPYMDLFENLVVAYRLDETSGDRYPSIGSYLLTENGTVSSNTGKIGTAAEFSGANNLYIDDATALQHGSFDYSVCAWAYLDDISVVRYLLAKDTATTREYGILFTPVGGGGTDPRFQAFIQTDVPNTYTVEASDIDIATGTWYFVHYWYVHAESNIYIRVNDGDTYSTYCNGETPRLSTGRFAVGARRDGSPTDFWDGRADALHWHQRVLSTGEHDILYSGGDGRELWLPVASTSNILTPGGTAKNSTGVATGDVVVWEAPFNATVTAVRATRKGGTGATINMRKNYASEHLATDLSLPAASTTYDGGAVQNASYAAGDVMEARIKSVAGGPTEIAIWARVQRT